MRSLIAMMATLPLAAGAAMLERAELVDMIPEAKANGGAYDVYFDADGRTEQWLVGSERVPVDPDAEEKPAGFVQEGTWRIKEVAKPEDFEDRSPEEQARILESIEQANTELRSVLCWTFAEREKCWDVERTSAVRVDPADPESELVKTQDYHLYREGRAETRDLIITVK